MKLVWLLIERFRYASEDEMPKPEIEEFARPLLREVRDRAIASCDALLDSEANNAISHRWRSAIESGSSRELL
jgi:hypothetical protein